MLCAAGAVLAAAFLQAGLAEGDPVVLSRLMGLLTLPLVNLEADCAAEDKQYAEWVGVRARVSLLEVRQKLGIPFPPLSPNTHLYPMCMRVCSLMQRRYSG